MMRAQRVLYFPPISPAQLRRRVANRQFVSSEAQHGVTYLVQQEKGGQVTFTPLYGDFRKELRKTIYKR